MFNPSTSLLLLAWSLTTGLAAQDRPLRFNHLVFFVSDTTLEHTLTRTLFEPAEALTTEHAAQGTEGRYVLFLNTSIEFLYLRDSAQAVRNEPRFRSAYTQRWVNTYPVAFGLIMEPIDTTATDLLVYHSADAPPGEVYLMATGNNDPAQPMIYASMPHRAHKTLASLEDVDQVDPAIRDDLRRYFTHPSGIQRLTRLVINHPEAEAATGNLALLAALEGVEVRLAVEHALILEFDDGEQGREFRVGRFPELIIRY